MSEKDKIKAAIKMLVENGEDLSKMLETGGLMHKLKKGLMEKALEAEMDEHMGYEKYDRSGEANSRNGTISKNLITESGPIELEVPRDREGTFAPQLVKKRQTRINGLDEKILSLYAKGMTLSDMRMQLKELYATDISESLISRVTDNVIEEVKIWQNRALDKVYPIVYFDCLVVKVREDKRIINKSVYLALGINMDGIRDILGLWISNNEGAKFWLNNMTELKNRGLEDILIACTDNLTGMNDAIKSVFPKTEHQLCIVHQIRNSLKYVSYKDRKTLVADLKPVYTASSEDSASLALDSFDEKWSKKYPQIVKSWKNKSLFRKVCK